MCTYCRLTQVFKSSKVLEFNDSSKFIFFSDCHRGDDSPADNFAPNEWLFYKALEFYYKNGFTYIENGDGDELWENRKFSVIKESHKEVFRLMGRFFREGRLFMIHGNHDIVKRKKSFVRKNLFFLDDKDKKGEPLFKDIEIHEGLILKDSKTGNKVFVVHGHQGDLLNDRLWPLARFLVRYIIRPLELITSRKRNPLSPASNSRIRAAVENRIAHWARIKKQITITGHTHAPAFPEPGRVPYFNDGSCVSRGYITGIEIENGKISLVKWSAETSNNDTPCISRQIIAGPKNLSEFKLV